MLGSNCCTLRLYEIYSPQHQYDVIISPLCLLNEAFIMQNMKYGDLFIV
jgi:hypothetical protein